MSRSVERSRPARPRKSSPAKKPRPKAPRRQLWFEATTQSDHVRMQANVPTKWFRVVFTLLIVIVIALLILKAPGLWEAIQTAINLVPK